MTLSTALFIFAAQLLAYLVKGLIGFGNPLISAPILSMGLDNVVITPGTLLLDCPVNAWITWKNRHSFQWRKILPLLAANFCGVIPGTLLLRFSMPWVIKTVLGVVVVLLGLEMATRSLRPVKPEPEEPILHIQIEAGTAILIGQVPRELRRIEAIHRIDCVQDLHCSFRHDNHTSYFLFLGDRTQLRVSCPRHHFNSMAFAAHGHSRL